MKKFFAAFATLVVCCAFALLAGCKVNKEQKKPEKIKDGTALTITAGESKSIDLSEYISIEGTEYAYAAESSDNSVATVAVEGNTATVTAVAEGSAEITASADAVEVKFAVTVNKEQQQQPEEKPAPVFSAKSLSYDLKDKKSADLTLAPDSGDSSYKYSYALKTADANVTIAGNKLTAAYGAATEKTLTVVATYTVGTDASTAKTVEFTVKVKVTDTRTPAQDPAAPSLNSQTVEISKDLYNESASSLTIDFAENVSNPDNVELKYEVKKGEDAVTLNGTTHEFVYGTYDESVTTVQYAVKISYKIKEVDGELNYTYTLKLKDTGAYRVDNGNFDRDFEGWTLKDDAAFGVISEEATFWPDVQGGLPVHNVGKYFKGDEPTVGALKSSLFKVGGSKKITFMLGAAGNKDCYITLEKEDGTVVALWRNVKFHDVGGGNWVKDQIGVTQFANNLVTYVADLSDYEGQSLRVVLNDNATENFGFINFDELVTYYATADEVPEGAVPVENELANKTALKEAIDGAITEQGDYTAESFNAYTEKVTEAEAVFAKLSATQEEVDAAKTAIETAFAELDVRVPAEKTGADKNVAILVGGSKEITISDYVDENNLSSITYTAAAADQKLTVSEITEGKFTVSASEAVETTVTITVLYKNEPTELTVTLTVKVTDGTPSVKDTAKEKNIDLYLETNATDITLDFAEHINNPAALTLGYTVTMDGNSVELSNTSCYTLTYGTTYNEEATPVEFNVQVTYTLNGTSDTLTYTYTLNIKDTRAYRIKNGDFNDKGTYANDLEGWTLSNDDLGAVNEQTTYWVGDEHKAEGYEFGNENKFFNAYATNKEDATGTLKSSEFKVSKSGWITYKLGGAKNIETVTFEVVSADGTKRAVLPNFDWSDVVGSDVRGCTLVAYKANLQSYGFAEGESVYILVTDNGTSEYGLFFLDSVETYYTQEPNGDDFNLVAPTRLLNGGFEHGNLTGWTCEGNIGRVVNESNWLSNSYNKEGNYLFTGFEHDGQKLEGNTGTLTSSAFEVGGCGWITYRLGGGKNSSLCYMSIIDAETGEELARFANSNFADGTMNVYKANLTELKGKSVKIKLTDNAIDDWGLLVADSFITYYETEEKIEENAITAENCLV